MGTAQSTHTTMEINDLPFEGKDVTSSSVSGRKTNDEDLVHVDIPMISTDDEVVETSDEEDSSDEESDDDYDEDDDEEGKLCFALLGYILYKTEAHQLKKPLLSLCSRRIFSV